MLSRDDMSAPITMATLAKSVGRCDLAAFRRTTGDAFLLYTGRPEELRPGRRQWQPTLDGQGRTVGDSAPERLCSMLVYPLQSPARPWGVTVGRAAAADVTIIDESVSISHAVITKTDEARFLIQDNGSKNGTFINEARLPGSGARRAVEIKSNNMVRFGSVVLTFLLPPEVFDLGRTLGALVAAVEHPPKPLSASELFSDVRSGSTGKTALSDRMLSYFDAVQHVHNKRYQSAQILLRDLLAAEPNNRNARTWLLLAEARALRQAGKHEEAAARYQAVLALDPHHEEARRAAKR